VSGPVRARLIALVADPDAGVAAAAAIAVATPGSRDAVAALARALARGAPKVQMAAIRGLGRVATRDAERALESAASSHPNPDTSRRARAELVKLRALTAPR
jgi:HEAT repeat protein